MNKIIIVGIGVVVIILLGLFYWLLITMRTKRKLVDSLPEVFVRNEYERDLKGIDDRYDYP